MTDFEPRAKHTTNSNKLSSSIVKLVKEKNESDFDENEAENMEDEEKTKISQGASVSPTKSTDRPKNTNSIGFLYLPFWWIFTMGFV